MFRLVFLQVLAHYIQIYFTVLLRTWYGTSFQPQFKNWWSDLENDRLIIVDRDQHAKTQVWPFTLFLYYHIWIFLLFKQLKTFICSQISSPTFRPHGMAPAVSSSVFTSCISEPTFVSSALDQSYGKLYFFFSEVGKEFSFVDDLKIARVAQVCKVSIHTERSPRLQNVTGHKSQEKPS